MIDLFIIAVMIGYYIDYKNEKKIYGKAGQTGLYLIMIFGTLIIALKHIFF